MHRVSCVDRHVASGAQHHLLAALEGARRRLHHQVGNVGRYVQCAVVLVRQSQVHFTRDGGI